jgi:hypothetical protein
LESMNGNACFSPYNNSWVRSKTPAESNLHQPEKITI